MFLGCTFEGNFCSWSQQSSKKVLWKISPLSPYRPAIDHTTMSSQGRYVFVDGWSSRGKVAQLVSQTVNEDDNVCFVKFVLYMYNVKSSDSLSLFIVDKQNNTIKRFENVSSIQTNNWHPIEMGSLNSPPSPQWRFVIQGNFDVNSNARVALDDVEYLSCPSNKSLHSYLYDILTESHFFPRHGSLHVLFWNMLLELRRKKLAVTNQHSVMAPSTRPKQSRPEQTRS